VSAETSLELVPCDGVDVHMGIVVRLPPVGCCPIELVRSKKDCHTRFLRPKPDAHRMYAQDQVVIHTVRM
jgi:hypothetical protein